MSQNVLCGFRMPNTTASAYPIPMIQIPQNPNARFRVFLPFPLNTPFQNYPQNLNIAGSGMEGKTFFPFPPNVFPFQDIAQHLNKAYNLNAAGERNCLPFTQNTPSNTSNPNEANNLNQNQRLFLPVITSSMSLQKNTQNSNSLNAKNAKEQILPELKPKSLPQNSNPHPHEANNIISDVEEIVPDFKCEMCNIRILTYFEFTEHKKSHEEADDMSTSSSRSSDSLFLALAKGSTNSSDDKTSNSADVTVFSCPYCERIFRYRLGLEKHIKTHQIKKNFSCTICKTKFSRYTSLRKHIMMLHGTNRVRRHCPYCIYRCFQSSDMEKHIARRHTRDFKFKCSLCPKGFTTPKELNNHLRRKHPNVRIITTSKVERTGICSNGSKFSPTLNENNKIQKFTSGNYSKKFRKNNRIFKPSTSIKTSKPILVAFNQELHGKLEEKLSPELKKLEEYKT